MARAGRSIAVAAALLLLAVWVGAPAFAGDPEGQPAAAKSLTPDQLSSTPQSPSSGPPKSVAPGEISAPSRSPDSLVAHARSPGAKLDASGGNSSASSAPSSAESPDLSQLPADAGGEDLPVASPKLVPEPPAPGPYATPALLKAWQKVRHAEKKLGATQAAYTKMMIRDYPLGAARVTIEKARDEAIASVNRARRRYARLSARAQ